MSRWRAIREAFANLATACQAGDDLAATWGAFAALARESEAAPPTHLLAALQWLDRLAAERDGRASVVILDHGTGTGINILYLAALGYTNVWGANVVDKAQPQNRVFREILGAETDRIFLYDGAVLPMTDESVDLVVSQQVVEHLSDDVLDAYYREEGRVLRKGGLALHQAPHRWMPYDGHTRTWFVSLLPKFLRDPIWPRVAHHPEQIGSYLFLRDRRDHFDRARRYIGETSDESLLRLGDSLRADDYEGPRSLGYVRRAIGTLVATPGVGPLARLALRPICMLETVSVKR